MHVQRKYTGFTIVEVLIVIVVIAILAAISVVAYNGIQQRARNIATISAVENSLRMLGVYVTQNEKYPMDWDGDVCITTASGCGSVSSNAGFDAAMATVGNLPRSISDSQGIVMSYHSNATYNGTSAPARLTYYLSGTNQKCAIPGVETYTWPAYTSSTTGYTVGNDNGKTLCWINIPGPGE